VGDGAAGESVTEVTDTDGGVVSLDDRVEAGRVTEPFEVGSVSEDAEQFVLHRR
jgi:hypothetical protein